MNLHIDSTAKASYKFNEIASITGVKPYVLRFWESEFDQISPVVNEVGQKYYSRSDLQTIIRVKKLLFDDKLSIPQAKGYLDREMIDEESQDLLEESAPELIVETLKEQSEDLRLDFEKAISDRQEKVELSDIHENEIFKIQDLAQQENSPDLIVAPLNEQVEVSDKIDNEIIQSQEFQIENTDSFQQEQVEISEKEIEEIDKKLSMETQIVQDKASIIADQIRNDVGLLRVFKDADVVSLVSAKKKLTGLVGRIDEICKSHSWQ